jgi:uncharacterized membrane protein YfcA
MLKRSDWMLIVTLVVISIAAEIAIGVLTVMGAPEYIEFAIVIILMVAILVGSYFFRRHTDAAKSPEGARHRVVVVVVVVVIRVNQRTELRGSGLLSYGKGFMPA